VLDRLLEAIVALPDLAELSIAQLYMRSPVLSQMKVGFDRSGARIATIDHPACVGKEALLRPYIHARGTFVDIGCGLDILGERVKRSLPQLERAIGVDVQQQRYDTRPDGVEFRLMERPDRLPLGDGEADTMAATFVLHHLDVDLAQYLAEVVRVLAPGGRFLVLEDSFPEGLPTAQSHHDRHEDPRVAQISRSLFALPDDEARLSFLHFADWFIHNFVNHAREPLVPGHYRTIEGWSAALLRSGLTLLHCEYLGFSAMGSRNPVARALLVLEKTRAG